MKVIFTFNQTKKFDLPSQEAINAIDYSEIPEMRIIDKIDLEGNLISRTIPYQANVTADKMDDMINLLSYYGDAQTIGIWEDNGKQLSLDKIAYKDALKDVEIFEKAVFLNGEDFTGREDEFVPVPTLDENGKELFINGEQLFTAPSRHEFTRVKSTHKATELRQVSSFDKKLNRIL